MGPRFGEFCSCCCIPFLPELAYNTLVIWGPPFSLAMKFQASFIFSSVESTLYKGTAVLIRAVRKILGSRESAMRRQKCVLEISDKGIKMIDKSKGEVRGREVISLQTHWKPYIK